MKNLLFGLLLMPLITFSHEYEYTDSRGRVVERYLVKDDIIKIKDNRGRTTGYIKDENLYNNRGRKQGTFIKKNDLL